MDPLFEFVNKMCADYGIDESHGVKHAKGTAARAQQILQTLELVSPEERRMAVYAAALHDTCDHKYADVEEASGKIKEWLISVGWSKNDSEALIGIITTMSYSQLKKKNSPGLEPIYPDHGKWSRAYHVARSADILESYIVARCILYDRHISPTKTEDEHWQRAEELFKERVFRYRLERWLMIPEAVRQSIELEEVAKHCLSNRSLEWPELVPQPFNTQ
jgi:exopolyphosphatase/pppGpp-phosphohydrolase